MIKVNIKSYGLHHNFVEYFYTRDFDIISKAKIRLECNEQTIDGVSYTIKTMVL